MTNLYDLLVLVAVVAFWLRWEHLANRQENQMSKIDDDIQALVAVTTPLLAAIASEINDLKTAVANGTATSESFSALEGATAGLNDALTALTADDTPPA